MKKILLFLILAMCISNKLDAQFYNYYQSALDVNTSVNRDIMELNNAYYKIETETNNSVNFHNNIRIIKTNSNGTVQWIKRFDAGPDSSLNTYSINKTLDNKIIICAQLANDNAIQPIGISIIKIDTSGTIKWTALFPGYRGESYSKHILQFSDSSFIIPALTPATLKPAFILLNSNGTSVNAKQIQNTVYSQPNDLTTLELKNNTLSFCFNQGEFITTDLSLNITSDKNYNLDHSIPYFIHKVAANGDYIFISDITAGATFNGTFRIYRTTPSGNLLWAKNVIIWKNFTNHMPSSRFDVVQGKTILEEASGNIIVHIVNEESEGLVVTFDGAGNYLANKTIPATTLRLCADGQYLYESNFTSTNQSLFAKQPLSLNACDTLIDVHVSSGSDSISNAVTNVSLAPSTISLLHYNINVISATTTISLYCNSTTTGVYELSSKNLQRLVLYPNPVENTLKINIENQQQQIQLRIIDVFGKIISAANYSGSNSVVDISNLLSGTYIIEAATQSSIFRQKFIKQ